MLLIGENIHIISKSVRAALENRDRVFIENLISQQTDMDYVDLNIGPARGKLDGVMPWLVDIVQSTTDKGISFDTSNFSQIKEGFRVCKNKSKVFINSTSRDEEKLELLTGLAAENNCKVERKEWKSKYNSYVIYDYEPFCSDGFEINIVLSSLSREHLDFLKYLYENKINTIEYLNSCVIS